MQFPPDRAFTNKKQYEFGHYATSNKTLIVYLKTAQLIICWVSNSPISLKILKIKKYTHMRKY